MHDGCAICQAISSAPVLRGLMSACVVTALLWCPSRTPHAPLCCLTVSAAPWWRWRARPRVDAPPQRWWTDRAVPDLQGTRRWRTPVVGTSVHSASTPAPIWLSTSGAFMWTGREEGSVHFKFVDMLYVDPLILFGRFPRKAKVPFSCGVSLLISYCMTVKRFVEVFSFYRCIKEKKSHYETQTFS